MKETFDDVWDEDDQCYDSSMSQRTINRITSAYEKQGYLEAVTAGKDNEELLQKGFNIGFEMSKSISLAYGRLYGVLECVSLRIEEAIENEQDTSHQSKLRSLKEDIGAFIQNSALDKPVFAFPPFPLPSNSLTERFAIDKTEESIWREQLATELGALKETAQPLISRLHELLPSLGAISLEHEKLI